MARPRKPTEALELSGAFIKDPQRKREVGPKSKRPLGEPPPHLSEVEAGCWVELQTMAPHGVLTGADRWLVARFCQLEAKARLNDLTNGEGTLHVRCMSLMGLTPADRSRIQAEREQEASPFAEFMQ